jgi:hypothetical protein
VFVNICLVTKYFERIEYIFRVVIYFTYILGGRAIDLCSFCIINVLRALPLIYGHVTDLAKTTSLKAEQMLATVMKNKIVRQNCDVMENFLWPDLESACQNFTGSCLLWYRNNVD